MVSLRRLSKKFVDFVNKIKSTDAISLKLPYVKLSIFVPIKLTANIVCSQLDRNKYEKFQTNRLINLVAMTICSMHVRATWSTPRR